MCVCVRAKAGKAERKRVLYIVFAETALNITLCFVWAFRMNSENSKKVWNVWG